jgi:hypothetical protein
MIISILLNLILSILLLYILYNLKQIKLINKKLFTRSWRFELFILTIYNEVNANRKKEIKNLLDSVKVL